MLELRQHVGNAAADRLEESDRKAREANRGRSRPGAAGSIILPGQDFGGTHCLATYTAGEARILVRQAKRPNGLDAFRLLQARFNPPLTIGRQRADKPTGIRLLAQLSSEIIAWENRIVEYDSKPGADVVSESLKMATIVAMCPAKLKEHLEMNAARYSRHHEICEEVFTFLDYVHGHPHLWILVQGA